MTEGQIIETYGVGVLIAILAIQLGIKAVSFARSKSRVETRRTSITQMCVDHAAAISHNKATIDGIKSDISEIKETTARIDQKIDAIQKHRGK